MQYQKFFKSGACAGNCHFKVWEKSGHNQMLDPKANHAEEEEPKGEEGDNQKEGDAEPSTVTLIVEEPPRAFVPKAPYPERLQALKNGGKLKDILEVFKQVQINIPFFLRHPANPFVCQVLEGLDHSKEEDECSE
jgi:hypothetical protein